MSRADAFNEAMTLWLDLAAIDPDSSYWSSRKADTEEIVELIKLDPSLVTSFFLLQALSDDYFENRKVSIDDLDTDPNRVMEYMMKVRQFREIIKSPELLAIGIEFEQTMVKALSHYGVPTDGIATLMESRYNLAYLRRDALTSMERLKVSQFLSGEYDPKDIQPVYNPTVFSYWNMNSCIEHLCGMPSGMSVNLIRDPDELHSYFCITVRNGGNLITLSDVPQYAHPLGRYMSRRPDRAFGKRAAQNWFPYDLLNIAYDEEGNPYHDVYRKSIETGLVPHQPSYFKLKEMKELDPAIAAWTIMVFDLIKEKYWKQQPAPLPLSYTAEMVRITDSNKLLGAAASANLPITGYQPINLPRLTIEDVKTPALDEAAIGRSAATTDNTSFGHNRWMEDRYGDKVAEEVLNLLSVGDRKLFLTSDNAPIKADSFGNGKSLAILEGGVQSLPPEELKSHRFFNRDLATYNLHGLDATTFGTREQIDADRKFLARHNFAKAIQREADREYEARKEEVRAWVRERITTNINNLLPFTTVDEVYRTKTARGFVREGSLERYRFAETQPIKTREVSDDWRTRGKVSHKTDWDAFIETVAEFPRRSAENGWEFECYLNDCKAYWFTIIKPRSIEEIAFMCGVTVDELPDILKFWRHRNDEPYTGNSILNRIDPLEWALTTPWEKENFAVRIYLSKRARSKLQKELTAPSQEELVV